MTRDNEIRFASLEYSEETDLKLAPIDLAEEGFMAGAKWADAHNEGLNMHIKYLKEELIDNACEWLENNTGKFVQESLTSIYISSAFIDAFRKAMKGDAK